MSRTHARRTGLWLPISMGVLLAAVVGVLAWRFVAPAPVVREAPLASSPAIVTAPSPIPPPPSGRTVTVAASAPGKLYLGAVLVGPLPAELQVEAGSEPRTYTIRAPGFLPQDVRVAEGSASRIEVSLEKVPQLVPVGSRAPLPSAPPATTRPGAGGIIVDPWK